MKKLVLLFVAGLVLGGAAFAKEENGALGFGIVSESSKGAVVSGNIRGALFLDVGYQLAGPVFYGFEFFGDLKQMSQDSFKIQKSDVTAFGLGGGDYILFINTSQWKQTYTLWDADFSPRGYLSFDLGTSIQLLGFAGLNYNWQTMDYKAENIGNSDQTLDDGKTVVKKGDSYTKSSQVGSGFWSLVAGFRVSVGAFYVDYTRFLDDSSNQVSWTAYNKDRLGFGINLRF